MKNRFSTVSMSIVKVLSKLWRKLINSISHMWDQLQCIHSIPYAAEYLELTRHLWYEDGTAASAITPFSMNFDLNEVVFSRRDVQLHTGLIGFQYRSHSIPGLTIHNLVEGEKHSTQSRTESQKLQMCMKRHLLLNQDLRYPFHEIFNNNALVLFQPCKMCTEYDSKLSWLKEAKFLLCNSAHFITQNRSFNFERPDRSNP